MKPRIYITDFITDDLRVEKEILGELADITALARQNEEELRGRIEDATCLMVYHFLTLRSPSIDRLTQCKLIVRCGVGIDAVDIAAARRKAIDVVNIPDYGTEEVADSAIGLMLALARGVNLLNSRLRAARGEWSYTQTTPLHRLRGRTFAIVGMGRIGTAAAHRAKALGMPVIFYDPYVPDGWEKAHAVQRARSLPELLASADVLSLHCPATRETNRPHRRGRDCPNASRQPGDKHLARPGAGYGSDPARNCFGAIGRSGHRCSAEGTPAT